MKGTSLEATSPMRRIPPTITRPTAKASTPPKSTEPAVPRSAGKTASEAIWA